jgi:hypothetical protein
MARKIAETWEQGHLQAIGSGGKSSGYGGLIKAEHAKDLMLASGKDIIEAQFQSQVQSSIPPPPLLFASRAPTVLPLHAQLPPKPPPSKKQKLFYVFKGMSTDLINGLRKVDIVAALRNLNKATSNKDKEMLSKMLASALKKRKIHSN